MLEVERVNMREVGDDDVLAGSADGAQAFAALVGRVAELGEARVVLLDYAEVTVATASFMREAVIGFRNYCRESRPNLYPVVANANLKVEEELDNLLQLKGD